MSEVSDEARDSTLAAIGVVAARLRALQGECTYADAHKSMLLEVTTQQDPLEVLSALATLTALMTQALAALGHGSAEDVLDAMAASVRGRESENDL